MPAMPRPRPPYLQRRIARNGEVVWYVRIGRGPLVRIRGTYGGPEFIAAYQAAVAGEKPPAKGAPAKGTLAWLLDLHRASSYWAGLKPSTKRKRDNIYRKALESAGANDLSTFDKQSIINGRDRRAKTPAQARHFVHSMRALFKWALDANLVPADPTLGVTTRKPKKGGIPVWTDEEITRYEDRWPLGTRERVMLDLFVYTGLRIGDVARIGKQHVRNGIITIDTEKGDMRVTIPMLRPLKLTLDKGPTGDLAFVATKGGRPMLKNSLGNAFKEACKAAGIDKSAHGIRKAAATHAAENGATVAELEAIFGWKGGVMASHYTQSANRKALAAGAIGQAGSDFYATASGNCGSAGPKR
jgi:integrase